MALQADCYLHGDLLAVAEYQLIWMGTEVQT